jgi:hypothetical protein
VASKPDRLEKDLANAKKLAAILEDEHVKLCRTKMVKKENKDIIMEVGEGGKVEDQTDAVMADPVVPEDHDEDPELREKGAEAVEQRIEKIMADLREEGLVDINDEKAYGAKRVSINFASSTILLIEPLQTVVSLDLYIAYLRAAFHTCYYCSVVTDHLEELQRKCLKHARKPLSKMLLEEVKAAEAEKAEKERKVNEDDKEKDPTDKDSPIKEKMNENRDWKRNGMFWSYLCDCGHLLHFDR